jgi:hypothetical protein
MKPWPYPEIPYHNSCTDPCDAWEGNCACGATHQKGEFQGIEQDWDDWVYIYRFGKCVAGGVTKGSTFDDT